MSSLVRRAKFLVIGAGLIGAAIASCGERSLVLLHVTSATAGVSYENDTLVIVANHQQTTTFQNVSFDDQPGNAYKAGVYLPSDVSGQVTLVAEVDDPQLNCKVGMGSLTVDGVSGGDATAIMTLQITQVLPCVPLGTGTGGGIGTGGTPGTGGNATGGSAGSPGTGGSSTGGVAGSGQGGATGGGGGTTGTGGVAGAGGVKGSGGSGGRGGLGGSGGAGGMTGTGGMKGTGGMIPTGGTNGSGGTGGIVATGGTLGSGGLGSGGVMGTGGAGTGGVMGSGGVSGCGCTIPNGVCDATGKCVCNESDADACSAAGIACGTATNICQQSVTCSCPANEICDTTTGTCRLICIGGTGGIVAASPDAICPLMTQ